MTIIEAIKNGKQFKRPNGLHFYSEYSHIPAKDILCDDWILEDDPGFLKKEAKKELTILDNVILDLQNKAKQDAYSEMLERCNRFFYEVLQLKEFLRNKQSYLNGPGLK